MAYLAGDTITDAVYVTNASGDPSALGADAVFSSAVVTAPGGDTSTPTIQTTATPGLYQVSFPTALEVAGTYAVLLYASETNTAYLATYDVDLTTAAASAIGLAGLGTTFSDFRLAVAMELRDGMALRATADGAANVFIDSLNLTDGTDEYRGSHGVVVSATNGFNVGQRVRVDSSSPLTTSLTFVSALPAPTKAFDVLHLFNLGGYGWRPQFYDEAIQSAVRAASPDYLIETVVASSAAFDADTPLITVTSPLVAVFSVEVLEDADTADAAWRTIPKSRMPGRWGHGWSLDRGSGTLRIDGCWADIADGLAYRVRGYAPHAVPAAADDLLTLDYGWLMLQTKATLAARRGTDRTWSQWAVEWGRRADEQRGRIATSLQPDTEYL